ncbi:MAG: hypothetical protein ABIE36_02075 [Candidatus Diapherotrites archaeon]
MKRYFLSYNELTKDYYLDYGCFDQQRQFLGKIDGEKLLEKLKEILPMHRQIIIYSKRTLDDSVKELLLKSFKNTRISLEFKKDLAKLC